MIHLYIQPYKKLYTGDNRSFKWEEKFLKSEVEEGKLTNTLILRMFEKVIQKFTIL